MKDDIGTKRRNLVENCLLVSNVREDDAVIGKIRPAIETQLGGVQRGLVAV